MKLAEGAHDEIASHAALQRLLAAYADAVNRRAWSELSELFLADARIELRYRATAHRHIEERKCRSLLPGGYAPCATTTERDTLTRVRRQLFDGLEERGGDPRPGTAPSATRRSPA